MIPVFSPNTGKYGPGENLHSDNFNTVIFNPYTLNVPITWTPLNGFPKKLIVVNIWLEHKWKKITEI